MNSNGGTDDGAAHVRQAAVLTSDNDGYIKRKSERDVRRNGGPSMPSFMPSTAAARPSQFLKKEDRLPVLRAPVQLRAGVGKGKYITDEILEREVERLNQKWTPLTVHEAMDWFHGNCVAYAQASVFPGIQRRSAQKCIETWKRVIKHLQKNYNLDIIDENRVQRSRMLLKDLDDLEAEGGYRLTHAERFQIIDIRPEYNAQLFLLTKGRLARSQEDDILAAIRKHYPVKDQAQATSSPDAMDVA